MDGGHLAAGELGFHRGIYGWLSGPGETNIVKFTYDWQNDGHQKGTFLTASEDTESSAGCDEMKTHMHILSCKTPTSVNIFRKLSGIFNMAYKRICTASVILSAFFRITLYLRKGAGISLRRYHNTDLPLIHW